MKGALVRELTSGELRQLGYSLSVKDSGYISRDCATIIHLFRKLYHGHVGPYALGKEVEHEANIQALRDKRFLEE